MNKDAREVTSPLLRHEIAFIMGQIYNQEDFIKKTLNEVSLDETEVNIVRHEAILAYYDIEQDNSLMYQVY